MTTQAFLRGYGLDLRELENHKRSMRRKLYRLFFALVETYVGAGEYNNEEQYRENRERVRILTEELTEVQDESKRSTFYTGKNQEISG